MDYLRKLSSVTRFFRTAYMVKPEMDLIPVFCDMFFLWVITVLMLMFSLSAISLLDNPVARSFNTSISLSLITFWSWSASFGALFFKRWLMVEIITSDESEMAMVASSSDNNWWSKCAYTNPIHCVFMSWLFIDWYDFTLFWSREGFMITRLHFLFWSMNRISSMVFAFEI